MKFQTQAVFLVYIFINVIVTHADRDAPVYNVNLDLPEQARWANVVRDFKEIVPGIAQMLRKEVPAQLLPLLEEIASNVDLYLPKHYAAEIKGIAKVLNASIGEIALPNIIYELSAYCTSIVAIDKQGHLWHGRNLDYDFQNILKNLTLVVNFQRAGQTVFTATTFAGYVGVLTGQRPKAFTVSIDERDKKDGGWWLNALVAVLERKSKFISFLIRDTLETVPNFYTALAKLSNDTLIAPVYIILGGTQSAEGAVITRDRLKAKDVWRLKGGVDGWFLVETNYDHWKPPPSKDDRRDAAIKHMRAIGQAAINNNTIFSVLSTSPVLRSQGLTVYTTTMSAGQPEIYHTVIRK